MLNLQSVVPIIRVTDLNRAKDFYGGVLGLPPFVGGAAGLKPLPPDYAGYAAYDCGGGTALVIYEGPPSPAAHTLCSFQVQDLEAVMADLRSRGVTFEEYDLPGLKTVGGIATDAYERGAWFRDPDGHYLAISEPL
jgi:catechol 2,3-dioxygenase-like lactoylglutathione lyase family enzyme